MSTTEIILKTLFWAAFFTVICVLLGRATPRKWLFPNSSSWIQDILIGFSLLVIVLRLPYREDFPLAISATLLLTIACYSVIINTVIIRNRFKIENYWIAENILHKIGSTLASKSLLFWAIAILPGLTLIYAPLILDHALIYEYHGPDFNGNLISASYVMEGNKFSRLLMSLYQSSGSFAWWKFENTAYTHPDLREEIAVEFFVRSLRWGHGVLTALIAYFSHKAAWFSFFVLLVYASILTPLVIVDACLSRGIKLVTATLLAFAILASQTYVLMAYEGITVQLMVTPVLLFITLNWRQFVFSRINVGQKFVLAILLSAMLSTFGEGIQILAVFFTIAVVGYFANKNKFNIESRELLKSIFLIIGLWIAISPTIFIDFLLWTYGRSREGFHGGALHYDWSILPILMGVPYLKVGHNTGVLLLVEATQWVRLAEVLFIATIGLIFFRKGRQSGFDLAVGALTIGIIALTGHRYAIWKTAVILQPLLFVSAFQMIPDHFGRIAKEWGLGMLAAIGAAGFVILLWQYHLYAAPMHPEQFEIDTSLVKGKRVAIISPSESWVYLCIASAGEMYWVNSDLWRRYNVEPNLHINTVEKVNVALYFDCDAEGKSRCTRIKDSLGEKVPQRVIFPTEIPLSALLQPSGVINHLALNEFILKTYGVEIRGMEWPED